MIADPTGFLAVARERRKIMMRSTCRITRPSGERAFDPDTGTYGTRGETVIYTGPCQVKVKSTASPAQLDRLGSSEVATEAYEVILPHDVPRVDMADTVEVTASDDAWLVGRPLRVAWVELSVDSRTARRVLVYDQDRPAVNDA